MGSDNSNTKVSTTVQTKSYLEQLRNKYGMLAQTRHIKEAVRRLKRHEESMRWEECTKTPGRATILSEQQELSLVKGIQCTLVARCWFHWTLIYGWAEEIDVADERNDEPLSDPATLSQWLYSVSTGTGTVPVVFSQFRNANEGPGARRATSPTLSK